jgi:hypothetical protein
MLRVALAIAICLTLGATCGEGYARLALPFYKVTTSLIALPYPWTISDIDIAHDGASHSAVLRLKGDVRRHRDDPQPVATVVTRVLTVAASTNLSHTFATIPGLAARARAKS